MINGRCWGGRGYGEEPIDRIPDVWVLSERAESKPREGTTQRWNPNVNCDFS